jgi:fructokinase
MVQGLLQARPPQVKTLYDVNLRPDGFSRAILEDSLMQTDILKLNAEELAILAKLFVPSLAPAERLSGLATRFNLEMVALTRGAEGSTLFTADALYRARPRRGVKIRDTVGAGDAYAAMLAAGVVLRWPAQKTLRLADRLAAKVCGIEGAIPEDPAFYADIDVGRTREGAHG